MGGRWCHYRCCWACGTRQLLSARARLPLAQRGRPCWSNISGAAPRMSAATAPPTPMPRRMQLKCALASQRTLALSPQATPAGLLARRQRHHRAADRSDGRTPRWEHDLPRGNPRSARMRPTSQPPLLLHRNQGGQQLRPCSQDIQAAARRSRSRALGGEGPMAAPLPKGAPPAWPRRVTSVNPPRCCRTAKAPRFPRRALQPYASSKAQALASRIAAVVCTARPHRPLVLHAAAAAVSTFSPRLHVRRRGGAPHVRAREIVPVSRRETATSAWSPCAPEHPATTRT